MWQTLLLTRRNPLFACQAVEEIVKDRQHHYYDVINKSTLQNDSAPFVTFMPEAINQALDELTPTKEIISPYVEKLLSVMGTRTLSAQEIMRELGLTNRQSFMRVYLHPALELGLVQMTIPDKPNSRLQTYCARLE